MLLKAALCLLKTLQLPIMADPGTLVRVCSLVRPDFVKAFQRNDSSGTLQRPAQWQFQAQWYSAWSLPVPAESQKQTLFES